jgi:RNA polymerase sigma-32 factor
MSQSTALTLRQAGVLVPLTGSLDGYIATVNRIPVLNPDEERALALRLRDDQDLDAARALVLANLRHVVNIARGYLGYGLPFADLVQEGNVGLMKAVKRFDPEVGVRLISFAVHWIKAEIHEFILRNWRIVKVATTKAQRKLFFNLRRAKQKLGWLSQDEVDAVASNLNVRPDEVLTMESRLSGHDVSFSATPADGDNAYVPEDWLADPADPIAEIEKSEWQDQQETHLSQALMTLDDRARDIIYSRWLNDGDKKGLQELADKYGVSAERIRQIETASMKKLRKAIELS